jgi:hypothetical protein
MRAYRRPQQNPGEKCRLEDFRRQRKVGGVRGWDRAVVEPFRIRLSILERKV